MSSKSPRKVKKLALEQFFQGVVSKFPAREKQIERIAALVGEADESAFPCLFIYGPAATGKTAVVKSFLHDLSLPHAFINCIEAYTPRLLMESILNQISEVIPEPDNDFEGYATCVNTCDLIRLLKKIVLDKEIEETIYVVLDNCERLRDMPPSFLAALMRLQEITELNFCTILISEIIWEKFRNGFCFYEPYIISFPQYTKEEIIMILERECPEDCSRDCYQHYITLVLSVFLIVTRNLLELRYLAITNFPKYYEPVKSGEATEKDIRKLWRNIEPQLKRSLNTVYLRESTWEFNNNTKEKPVYELRANVELPFYSKFLLIAAYVASYNPPASDKRFFIKNTGKVYKRKSGFKKSTPANQHQKGPKAFPIWRLLSIFYIIVEEKVSPSVALMSQITNLVTLKLLEVKIGMEHPLSSPKYKCLVNLDFIRSIASTVRFDIGGYLFDFV